MRVAVTPTRTAAAPGSPVVLTVTVTNTTEIISGHVIRVLGVDPRWVEVSEENLSLFPGATGTSLVTLKLPPGLPAGERRVSVQVRQLTPPESATVVDVDLELPAVHRIHARMEPGSVTAGRRASFGMLAENTGNSPWTGSLAGSDEEGRVKFRFSPPRLDLAPGEHAAVEVAVRARRRIFGSLVVRPLSVRLVRDEERPDVEPPTVRGTFMQRPVLGRGALSLVGLLAAVTVFAVVITYALSGVVGRSAADRDLALQLAQAQQNAGAGTATGALSGTVRLLTAQRGVPGVTVEVFSASDTATAVTSSATDSNGAYTLSGLPAGSYKLRFRGAGFAELWYPQAMTDADASTVDLQTGQVRGGLDVRLGGLPATISGVVTGADPTGATVSLLLPGTGVATGSGGVASTVTTTSASGAVSAGATVQTVKVGGDGSFVLANVPSPSVYDLSVAKPGYATQVERIDVGGGEKRTGLEIRLRQGDGLISGTVSDHDGGLGGATISTQFDGTTVQTVSLTDRGKVGQFTLRGLPTPGTFSVVVSAPGYASQTLSLTLTAGEQLAGVGVTLGGAAGRLGGRVTTADGSSPAGVTVTVTNGSLTVVTVTDSEGVVGGWSVGGLPLPDTYTVTFSRADLSSQTRVVSLDPFGLVTGSGSAVTATTVDATLTSSTATLAGRTLQVDGTGTKRAVGEVLVSVTSGTSTYQVTSASLPLTDAGHYELDHLPPGTYTVTASARGARPTSRIVTLTAGKSTALDLSLAAPAGIHGVVYDAEGRPVPHAEVRLYVASQYPNTSVVTVETDTSGRYAMTNLDAPENYVVEYDYPAGSAPLASKTFTLEPSTDLRVDVHPDGTGGP